MKKHYVTPKAEKVVFDYSETVTACSNIWWFGFCIQYPTPPCNQPPKKEEVEKPKSNNNPYWGPGWGLHCS